jgi:hypothetical protein
VHVLMPATRSCSLSNATPAVGDGTDTDAFAL